MASASSSGRLGVVVAILGFVAGCWAGMGADEAGNLYCVVTGESAAVRPGAVPGQIVEPTPDGDGENGDADGACQAGEPRVCGQFEDGDEGEDRRFVSDECPDD